MPTGVMSIQYSSYHCIVPAKTLVSKYKSRSDKYNSIDREIAAVSEIGVFYPCLQAAKNDVASNSTLCRKKSQALDGFSNQLKDFLQKAAEKDTAVSKSFGYQQGVNWVATIFKLFGSAGPGGKAISSAYTLASSNDDATRLKAMNSMLKSMTKIDKTISNLNRLANLGQGYADSKAVKYLFGGNGAIAYKASEAGTWLNKFKSNVNRSTGPLDSFKKSGVTKTVAFVGLGVDLVVNASANEREYQSGSISRERMVAETITETLVDQATGWAIGTAVAAIAATSAAPGILTVAAVGVTTFLATEALDLGTRKLTGALFGEEKGFTEAFSDGILDTGKLVFDTGKAVVSGGAKICSNVGKAVSDGWSGLRKGFASLF